MTQAQALDILKTGANVFLTGEPGAGKTHTINEYVKYLREHQIEPAITASTGIAATHIHGQTIHSWSGIGVRRHLSSYDIDAIASTEYLAKRIAKTKVLIIDEISMIDGQTLSMVEAVCRAIKQREEPFGGMQVVLVGDFFQLPPVNKGGGETLFAFQSPVWQSMRMVVCYLTEQHRQNDEQFLSILSAIRQNEYDQMHHEYIENRFITDSIAQKEHHSITRLFSHNADVDTLNNQALEKIDAQARTFLMHSKGKATTVEALKRGCLSPETLILKVGAVVMCTKNSRDKGFVNGTLGTVTGFHGATRYPIITTQDGRGIVVEPMDWNVEENGKIKASITQVPLRLAWAITIHKSQGMSLDVAIMDLRQVFEYGQGYVALSRVRTLSGLYLLGVNERTFQVHPVILEEDSKFKDSSALARLSFSEMSPNDLVEMHHNFIIAIGGQIRVSKDKIKKAKKTTMDITLDLILEGKSITEITKERRLSRGTIIGHLEKLVEKNLLTFDQAENLLDDKLRQALPDIRDTFEALDTTLLSPVFGHYGGRYAFDTLRLARVAILAQKNG